MPNKPLYGLIASDIAHVGVYLLEKSDSLLDVVRLMDGKHISAVIIEDLDDLKHYFIISTRDIINFLSKSLGKLSKIADPSLGTIDMASVPASEIMRGPIEIVKKNTPIDEIIYIMNKTGFKRLIVGNECGQPIGIISTRDIIAWNEDILPIGTPILLCVIENDTGLIISRFVFRDDISDDYTDLLAGLINAIESMTDELIQNSGDIRFIEKDNYDIMLEQSEKITVALICDESSIKLRIELKLFLKRFLEQYSPELELRKKTWYIRPIDVFKIRNLVQIFN